MPSSGASQPKDGSQSATRASERPTHTESKVSHSKQVTITCVELFAARGIIQVRLLAQTITRTARQETWGADMHAGIRAGVGAYLTMHPVLEKSPDDLVTRQGGDGPKAADEHPAHPATEIKRYIKLHFRPARHYTSAGQYRAAARSDQLTPQDEAAHC